MKLGQLYPLAVLTSFVTGTNFPTDVVAIADIPSFAPVADAEEELPALLQAEALAQVPATYEHNIEPINELHPDLLAGQHGPAPDFETGRDSSLDAPGEATLSQEEGANEFDDTKLPGDALEGYAQPAELTPDDPLMNQDHLEEPAQSESAIEAPLANLEGAATNVDEDALSQRADEGEQDRQEHEGQELPNDPEMVAAVEQPPEVAASASATTEHNLKGAASVTATVESEAGEAPFETDEKAAEEQSLEGASEADALQPSLEPAFIDDKVLEEPLVGAAYSEQMPTANLDLDADADDMLKISPSESSEVVSAAETDEADLPAAAVDEKTAYAASEEASEDMKADNTVEGASEKKDVDEDSQMEAADSPETDPTVDIIFRGMTDDDVAETSEDDIMGSAAANAADVTKLEVRWTDGPLKGPHNADQHIVVNRVANDEELAVAAANVRKAWLLLNPRSIETLITSEGSAEVGLPMRIAMLASVLSDVIDELDVMKTVRLHYVKGQSLVTTSTTTTSPQRPALPFLSPSLVRPSVAPTRPPIITSPFSSLWPNGSIPRLGIGRIHPAPLTPTAASNPLAGLAPFLSGLAPRQLGEDENIEYGNQLYSDYSRDEKRKIWDAFIYNSRQSSSVEEENALLNQLQSPRRRLTEVALTYDRYQELSFDPNVRRLGEDLSHLSSTIDHSKQLINPATHQVDYSSINTVGEKILYAASLVNDLLANGDFSVPLIEAARLYLATLEHESQEKLMDTLNRASGSDDADFIEFRAKHDIDGELEVGLLLLSRLQSIISARKRV